MKKITFTLKMKDQIPPHGDFTLEWDGYAIAGVEGLAVHRPPKRDYQSGPRGFCKGNGWRVIHLESGGFIGFECMNYRKDAAEFTRKLGEVGCDWTQPYEALAEYTEQIKAVIADFK